MKIQHVPLQYAAQTWPLVESYLQASLEHARGEYTISQIKMSLLTGQWLLIVAMDDKQKIHGAMTVEFQNRANHRVAFVTNTGGKFIIDEDTFKQLENICRANGATSVECAARDSVAKLLSRFGFKDKYRILEVLL
jgi:hypothetical protein